MNQISEFSAAAAAAYAVVDSERFAVRATTAWRVLVVEDVPSLQKLLVLMLRKAGHEVFAASTGREAVEAAIHQEFDFVLMDIQMPGMNGIDAMRAIRAHEAQHGGRAVIVAITAHSLNGDSPTCQAAGADAWLRKPVNLVDLLALLKRLDSAR